MKQDYVAGLDIGTTKICTVVARLSQEGALNVVGVGNVPARGVSKGSIIDLRQAARSIQESVQAASHMAGFSIHKALVGVTGTHIRAENSRGAVTVGSALEGTSAGVSRRDIARAFESAASIAPQDREILHLVPRGFVLDGQRGITAPLGMNASRLEADVHLVTAASSSLKNVLDGTRQAGLEAQALVLEPIATSAAVSTADERELGVVIIDIGGGTSDIAVFCKGALHSSVIVPVGGNHVTRDISIGLRTPFDIAERLKIESGALTANPHEKDALLEIVAASGERLSMPRSALARIIAPRMTEMFEMARDAINCEAIREQVPSGIILTGGGALLPGAAALAQRVFGLPARVGQPAQVAGWSELVDSPKFATAVGLLCYAQRLQTEDYAFAQLPGKLGAARRIWSIPAEDFRQEAVPTEIAAPSELRDGAEPVTDVPVPKPVPSPAGAALSKNIMPAISNSWKGMVNFLQPLMDRLRQLLGLDLE